MSMLTFYVNHGGKNVPRRRREVLDRAGDKLRELFHKPKRT